MAIRIISGSGNVHRGAFLLSSSTPIHCHHPPFLPIKRSAFFVPKNSSPLPFSNPKAKRRIRALECYSRDDQNRVQSKIEDDFGSSSESEEDFLVVSFYKFVCIKDPEAEVSNHLTFLQGRDIHGRIYVNEQGINAQYSGPTKDALAYAEWLKDDHKFSDILVQTSPAFNGHAFPRLKLRLREALCTFLCWTLQCERHRLLLQNGEKDWKL